MLGILEMSIDNVSTPYGCVRLLSSLDTLWLCRIPKLNVMKWIKANSDSTTMNHLVSFWVFVRETNEKSQLSFAEIDTHLCKGSIKYDVTTTKDACVYLCKGNCIISPRIIVLHLDTHVILCIYFT